MKQLNDFFQNRTVQNILDVGTGNGNFLGVLKETFPNADITGIDPNAESLKEASENFPDVKFQKMGAENIEFPDNLFDVVTISMALHHLSDVAGALKEMRRVTKPGGWIIVNELFSDNLNPAQEVHKLYHHFGSQIDRIHGVSHNESFKKDEIFKMVKDSGIDIKIQFEYRKEANLISANEIGERVEKMKSKLESIKDYPEYEILKLQIEEFRINVEKFDFQSATRVVIIGREWI